MQKRHILSISGPRPTCDNPLQNIEETGPASWSTVSGAPAPDTPTESMEFLARSWSISAMELSRALSTTHGGSKVLEKPPSASTVGVASPLPSKDSLPIGDSPPVSPRDSDEMKGKHKRSFTWQPLLLQQELFLLHQALKPEFLSSQQLLRHGLYRSLLRGKVKGRLLKGQKERKKQEMRAHNAQLHAAVSVAGVAAAVAAIAASLEMQVMMTHKKNPPKNSAAMASAAALVASHCIEIAEDMGAERDHILTVVNSAINARTNGDIMTLTAGAATALRGAATLRAKLQKGIGAAAFSLMEDRCEDGKESNILSVLEFVYRGGELLKRTRKGALHWKLVSFNINSNWQVVAKMKSKYMAGTFTKKKKCVVFGVCSDTPAWPGRDREDDNEQRAYFGIKTADRIVEFECGSKADKQLWIEGIQLLLNCRSQFK